MNNIDNIKDTKRYYNTDKTLHTTELLLTDGTTKYIFIDFGMIFVADYCWQELTARIDADEYEGFESYDTTDGVCYYARSEWADEIADALLAIAMDHLDR